MFTNEGIEQQQKRQAWKSCLREDKVKRKKNTGWLLYVMLFILLVLGIGLFIYPALSSYLAELNQEEVIETYDEALLKMKKEEYEKEWKKAVAYNEALAGDPVRDPFLEGSGRALPEDYLSVLNIGGVMGTIEIPKISVDLPIYHGTEPETLEKGVGHIRQTALPVGGKGTHSVLTGHTGLPNAKLFDNLTQLKKGDMFYIHILDRTLCYQVDGIHVVEPNDVKLLDPVPGKDYATLITCTPYGVNSHRLLVRGIRTKYDEKVLQEQKEQKKGMSAKELLILEITFLIIVIVLAVFTIHKNKRKRIKSLREEW